MLAAIFCICNCPVSMVLFAGTDSALEVRILMVKCSDES